MAYRDPHTSLRALNSIAVTQGGYFTAKQAAEAGYGYTHLVYHLKAGNFERADHGLYRIVTIPLAEHDELIRLNLWSRNQRDVPQATVSHETALSIHQLSDVLPRRVHLSVPRTFRKEPPAQCALHRARLSPADIEQREGFSLTTPLRTLLDVAGSKTVTDEQLGKAVDDALEKGLVRRPKLEAAVRATPSASRLLRALTARAIGRRLSMAKAFATPAAFKASLEARLKNVALQRGTDINSVRLKLVIERLLARLFASSNPPWILKGGYAMELRYRPRARTTRDIDLTCAGDKSTTLEARLTAVRDQLQEAAEADLHDFLTFQIAAPKTELAGAPLGGARFPCEAFLAGKIYGRFHIDLGFGDDPGDVPDLLTGDDLLAFAEIPPATVQAIPKSQQFAEKIHAYSKPWNDRENTRTKDLVDMVLLIETQSVLPTEVNSASKRTFARRATHELPKVLQAPPATWADDFHILAAEAQIKANDLKNAFASLSQFWATVTA